MERSSKNSGIALVKRAEIEVFRRKLVKVAKAEGEKLRQKRAEERNYRVWKYLAERTREIRKGWK